MFDQLIIEKKASYDDFGASVAERAISAPKKKSIKETVPFSNVTYDFSKINGELYWEERELKYVFEITADTPAGLEHKKANFSKWVMNVMNEKIYDPFDPDFHYVGTFEDIDYDDEDNVEKSTITVTFLAYPYKIANKATNTVFVVPAKSEKVCAVFNDSAHRMSPTITTDCTITVDYDDDSLVIPEGAYIVPAIVLGVGANVLTVRNASAYDCKVVFSLFEEVF